MEMTIQEVKTHDRAVETEIEDADEESREMMPYTRQRLLKKIQSMASIMALPIAPEKLNRKIVLNWRVFKISDITSMFHDHFDNWRKKQIEATGNVRYINQVFTMLNNILKENSFVDLDDVRKALEEATKETGTSVKVSKHFSFHSSSPFLN
ncbi:hypothetical protein CAEBREN_05441 [Caenorhabditis brenneri]|uniref:Uncharacterized protein n=1 Tax=Caenorhabditis brenneri TaxID=135651 RepID=G0NB78_CAEBE|nr:hypothetical protein CAEBREN_05441 [Caenorhabditis brenneri]